MKKDKYEDQSYEIRKARRKTDTTLDTFRQHENDIEKYEREIGELTPKLEQLQK